MTGNANKKCDQLAKLAEFTESLTSMENMETLIERSLQFIHDSIKPTSISNQLFDAQSLQFMHETIIGAAPPRTLLPTLEFSTDVIRCVDRGGEPLSLPDEHSGNYLFLFDPGQALPCEMRIPFFIRKSFIGIFNFGQKESGEKYRVTDIDFVRIVVNAFVLAAELCQDRWLENSGPISGQPAAAARNALRIKPHVSLKVRDEDTALIGESTAIHAIREIVDKVAQEEVAVLIIGESGTGKELVARDIHRKSRRSDRRLVAMNCAAVPESLVESELFGHEKGAFTGALYQKPGKFESAHNTTLFLDEIGDMSLPTQAKVLRVLQDGTFQRVGSNKTLYADVRLITATNKNVVQLLQQGLFRKDLYYRINVVQIQLPPLRERGRDIAILAQHFFDYYKKVYGKNLECIEPKVFDFLLHYAFPGNVRELKNMIERAVIMERSSSLTLDSISLIGPAASPPAAATESVSLEEMEKQHIQTILRQVHHNKSRAAEILGIARKTLREKLAKYHLE